MISKLAREDWEEFQATGLNPTLEDFDRLNCIALRLTDGEETTCANFPRIGWAGDVPFFEPTIQAFAWYHTYAVRTAANTETENTLWAFALAHAREPNFFDALTTPEAIDKAASAWAASLPVTREEVVRACRYATHGFDDAEAAKSDIAQPVYRASRSDAAKNLAELEDQIIAACTDLHAKPQDIACETLSRLNRLCEAAAVELGKKVGKDEALLRADYDLTYREILRRLKAEKEAATAAESAHNAQGGQPCQ